jgi:aldose 1-epimerase
LREASEQLARARGFDHCWVISKASGELALHATVFEPTTGIALDVFSTQSGLQFYTGNRLDGLVGKKGRRHAPRNGLCLEPQHFPNAPNNPSLPSATLGPGQLYDHTIIYRFATRTRAEGDALIERLAQTSTAPSYPRER